MSVVSAEGASPCSIPCDFNTGKTARTESWWLLGTSGGKEGGAGTRGEGPCIGVTHGWASEGRSRGHSLVLGHLLLEPSPKPCGLHGRTRLSSGSPARLLPPRGLAGGPRGLVSHALWEVGARFLAGTWAADQSSRCRATLQPTRRCLPVLLSRPPSSGFRLWLSKGFLRNTQKPW